MTTATPSFDRTKSMSGPPGPPGALPNGSDMKQRLLKNKPLLGLGIVVLLLLSVGTFFEAPSHTKRQSEDGDGSQAQRPGSHSGAQHGARSAMAPAPSSGLTPELATEFVKWWISRSMDYSPATAGKSHAEAFGWMTQPAAQTFQQVFWTPQIAQGITQGRMTAAFQPVSVQAEAINPDGSIVVGVTGSLVVQDSAAPVSQQIVTDFLVKKEKEGLRICGLYNRTTQQ